MSDKIGPTGEFPSGKLNESDEGSLAMGIAVDNKKKVLVLNFGTLVAWVALPKKEAMEFAAIIAQKASEIKE